MPWTKNFDVEVTLNRAMYEFWSRGYEATSVRDLVNVIGINKASLYDTYGDKHALFIAALHHYRDSWRDPYLVELEQRSSAVSAIRGLFRFWSAEALDDTRPRGCFLTNAGVELAPRDASVTALVAASQRDVERFFKRLVVRAQAQGEANPSLRPADTARTLLASLAGLLVLSRSRPEPALMRAIAQGAVATLT